MKKVYVVYEEFDRYGAYPLTVKCLEDRHALSDFLDELESKQDYGVDGYSIILIVEGTRLFDEKVSKFEITEGGDKDETKG